MKIVHVQNRNGIFGRMNNDKVRIHNVHRAFFTWHFGTMTHTPGIGNFGGKMPKIGIFFCAFGYIEIIKYIIYLSEFSCSVINF